MSAQPTAAARAESTAAMDRGSALPAGAHADRQHRRSETGARYEFEGREVKLPVFVRRASSATATYLVPADAARRLLPGDELEVAEVLPGRTLFSLASIDYVDNDLGDYNEVSMALFVRERGAPAGFPYVGAAVDFLRNRLGTYIHRLPVTQSFTREAGEGIWGFPKTVEQIEIANVDGRNRTVLECDGRHVLTFSVPCGGTRSLPAAEMTTYTYIGGAAHRTTFASGADDVGIHLGDAELTLGDHPIAAELRSLGLPKKPLLSVWLGSMYGRFDAPRAL